MWIGHLMFKSMTTSSYDVFNPSNFVCTYQRISQIAGTIGGRPFWPGNSSSSLWFSAKWSLAQGGSAQEHIGTIIENGAIEGSASKFELRKAL